MTATLFWALLALGGLGVAALSCIYERHIPPQRSVLQATGAVLVVVGACLAMLCAGRGHPRTAVQNPDAPRPWDTTAPFGNP